MHPFRKNYQLNDNKAWYSASTVEMYHRDCSRYIVLTSASLTNQNNNGQDIIQEKIIEAINFALK